MFKDTRKLGVDLFLLDDGWFANKYPRDNDLAFCQEAVQNYNTLKDVIWHGDQYRLVDPKRHNMAATMTVNETRTRAVMFNYLVNNRYDQKSRTPFRLKGLDPVKKYTVKEVNLYPGTRSRIDSSLTYSGEFLMTIGINPQVDASRQSVVLLVTAL